MGNMIRIALKTVVLITLPLGAPTAASAQVAQEIPFEEFQQFMLNGSVELWDLQEVAGNWPSLKNLMGNPEAESCEDLVLGEDCTFSWPGVTTRYTNAVTGDWEVHYVLILNGSSLKYGTVTISPGDSIAKISGIFPEAYAERGGSDAFDRWGCTHFAAVATGMSSVVFCYDQATTMIHKMLWWNYL